MKKIILVLTGFLWIILNCSTVFCNPEWYIKLKRIELLKSSYDTIVEMYGEPANSNGKILKKFETPDGDLFVTFSTGKCGTEYKKGYDVNEGIVERLEFSIKKKSRVKPKKLGFNLSQFEKTEVQDVPGIYVYENSDAGIFIGTDKNGLVDEIDFQPSSRFDDLYCGN